MILWKLVIYPAIFMTLFGAGMAVVVTVATVALALAVICAVVYVIWGCIYGLILANRKDTT